MSKKYIYDLWIFLQSWVYNNGGICCPGVWFLFQTKHNHVCMIWHPNISTQNSKSSATGYLGNWRLKAEKRRQLHNIKVLSLATSDNPVFLSRFSKLSPEQLNLRAALSGVHKTSKAKCSQLNWLISPTGRHLIISSCHLVIIPSCHAVRLSSYQSGSLSIC